MTDDPASEAPILLLVDDDDAVRRALSRLLTAAGYAVETFATARDLLEREPLTVAGCLILDVNLPGLSGLELHDLLRSTGMEKATIFISGEEDVSSSIRAMKSGAIDFLTKPIDADELLPAVQRAIARDRAIRSVDAELSVLRRRAARLTPREREVCALVASGRLNKQIAAVLGTSAKTVKVHRARVMTKLEVAPCPSWCGSRTGSACDIPARSRPRTRCRSTGRRLHCLPHSPRRAHVRTATSRMGELSLPPLDDPTAERDVQRDEILHLRAAQLEQLLLGRRTGCAPRRAPRESSTDALDVARAGERRDLALPPPCRAPAPRPARHRCCRPAERIRRPPGTRPGW